MIWKKILKVSFKETPTEQRVAEAGKRNTFAGNPSVNASRIKAEKQKQLDAEVEKLKAQAEKIRIRIQEIKRNRDSTPEMFRND